MAIYAIHIILDIYVWVHYIYPNTKLFFLENFPLYACYINIKKIQAIEWTRVAHLQ